MLYFRFVTWKSDINCSFRSFNTLTCKNHTTTNTFVNVQAEHTDGIGFIMNRLWDYWIANSNLKAVVCSRNQPDIQPLSNPSFPFEEIYGSRSPQVPSYQRSVTSISFTRSVPRLNYARSLISSIKQVVISSTHYTAKSTGFHHLFLFHITPEKACCRNVTEDAFVHNKTKHD